MFWGVIGEDMGDSYKTVPKGNAKQTEDFVLKACEHEVLQRKKERSL